MTNPAHHIQIIPFREELAAKFAELNKAWLVRYFTIEPLDQLILDDPLRYFIEPGGYIFFATYDNEIAGTFALLKVNASEFELAKMAVAENFQGLKIGNRMLEFAIAKARELKLKKLSLYSSTKLPPALHLYRKYGFVEVPVGHSEYQRSDIKMEREIENI